MDTNDIQEKFGEVVAAVKEQLDERSSIKGSIEKVKAEVAAQVEVVNCLRDEVQAIERDILAAIEAGHETKSLRTKYEKKSKDLQDAEKWSTILSNGSRVRIERLDSELRKANRLLTEAFESQLKPFKIEVQAAVIESFRAGLDMLDGWALHFKQTYDMLSLQPTDGGLVSRTRLEYGESLLPPDGSLYAIKAEDFVKGGELYEQFTRAWKRAKNC
jgi:hypothetical protein